MNQGLIAARYAKATFEFALKNGAQRKLYDEMRTLVDNFKAEPTLRNMLSNPMLDKQTKRELMKNAAGVEVSQYFMNFADLILSNKRESHIRTIALLYMDMFRSHNNVTLVHLTVADKIDKSLEERLGKAVGADKDGEIEFETSVDPTIGGGFVFQIGTYRMDASLASQLKRIKKQFVEKNKRII